MRRTRPASVTVIGILNLVFGGFGLMCGIINAALLVSGANAMFMNMGGINPGNNPQLAQQEELRKDVMKFAEASEPLPLKIAESIQSLLLSSLLLTAGIGLIRMQVWGRILCFVYAVLSLLTHVAHVVYVIVFTMPALRAITEQMAARGKEEQTFAGLMQLGAYVGIAVPIISMIYPTIVLILMARPAVSAAFRGDALPDAQKPASDQFEADDRWGRG